MYIYTYICIYINTYIYIYTFVLILLAPPSQSTWWVAWQLQCWQAVGNVPAACESETEDLQQLETSGISWYSIPALRNRISIHMNMNVNIIYICICTNIYQVIVLPLEFGQENLHCGAGLMSEAQAMEFVRLSQAKLVRPPAKPEWMLASCWQAYVRTWVWHQDTRFCYCCLLVGTLLTLGSGARLKS
jgi:hypothetical protein